MDWIILIVIGGIIGWIASMIMKTNEQQGLLANIVVGVVGALLGKWIFSDILGISGAQVAGNLSIGGILWGLGGAIVLIWILKALNIFK